VWRNTPGDAASSAIIMLAAKALGVPQCRLSGTLSAGALFDDMLNMVGRRRGQNRESPLETAENSSLTVTEQ